jgi:hypothetical protein
MLQLNSIHLNTQKDRLTIQNKIVIIVVIIIIQIYHRIKLTDKYINH